MRKRAEKIANYYCSGRGMTALEIDTLAGAIEAELTAAVAEEREKWEAAARPFAEAADNLRDELPDSHEIAYGITYGHVIALAALLMEEK